MGLPLGIVLASRGGAQVALLDIDPGKVDTVIEVACHSLKQGRRKFSSK